MDDPDLTIHEITLLKIDEAIRDPESPHRNEVNGGVRADRLANSMDGVGDRPASDYSYAIRDLCDTGDAADLGKLRLTEKGESRVRELRRRAEPVIDRNGLRRGPEPYLGWYLEGEPGSPVGHVSYICYASKDQGDGQFQVVVVFQVYFEDRAAQYDEARQAAFALARGLVFSGRWTDRGEHTLSLPLEAQIVPTPEIRDWIIRGLHRLYETGFDRTDVTVDYEGVAFALRVTKPLVTRAAEYLIDSGLITDAPATLGRNWSTGSIWLTARGVRYAEELKPADLVRSTESPSNIAGEDATWDLFIAHASEDKDEVARPLYDRLTRHGLKVWLDENQLHLGDSLRRKIDEGLAKSRYGLVILSKHFFAKKWPQDELDGLFALEATRGKTILPVWHGVDEKYIAGFSPTLAGKVGVPTSKGLDHVALEVLREVRRAALGDDR